MGGVFRKHGQMRIFRYIFVRKCKMKMQLARVRTAGNRM
jgi:hypothetical protein